MIERLVRHRDLRGQFQFAAQAKTRLPQDGAFVPAKSHRGLHLLARQEDDLASPLRALHGAYGSSLRVDRELKGVPTMDVRVGLELRHLPAVREELLRRGMNPSEEYVGTHYCVLRFQASAADLLGWPGELSRLTFGKASQQILVCGYR